MARVSFIERIQPTRQRWKTIEWPFPFEGEERPRIRVRVLGQDECESAYLAAMDHFKARKPALPPTDTAFAQRERAELVWRAFSSIDNEPLAVDVDELVAQPMAVLDELHMTWLQHQNDVCVAPRTSKQMDALVEALKKNMDPGRLAAWPSTWLIELISTLANRLSTSTQANEPT
jgi:hypothetical protein